MNRWTVARLCAALTLASGVIVSAQIQIPGEPAKQFGAGITGAFEGWYDNADGSHSFLVGYLNRNRAQEVDVPIGPNNKIELVPGGGPALQLTGPDMGQPTHFLAGRQTGMFVVTVPKEFTQQQRLTWTITHNGQTNVIPLRLHTDYNVSPFKDAAVGNTPPVLKFFDEKAQGIQGPIATLNKAMTRTASVAAPLQLPVWTEDDAKYTSGTNAPMRNPPPPVTLLWSLYRGPAKVTFDPEKPKFDTLAGGKPGEKYAGKSVVNAKFTEPGEYVLHATGNDYSGSGGGGEVCCWTTAMVKVTVAP